MIVSIQGINLLLFTESEVLYARPLGGLLLIRTPDQMQEAFDRIYRQVEDDADAEILAGRLGLRWFPIFQGPNGFPLPCEARVPSGDYVLQESLTWSKLVID